MKKKSILCVLLFSFLLGRSFSQSCIILGNAGYHGTQIGDGSLPDITTGELKGCYGGTTPYKQVFWQFFYSPTGGEFKQAYTPVGDNGLDLDYIVYDLGTTDPGTISCPINPEADDWNQIICSWAETTDIATGPGEPSPQGDVFMTEASHYYAIAIVLWQSGDSFPFTVGTPTINAIPLPLPVKLTSFDAKVNNCSVNLEWTAESESGFSNYEVQYSADGINFRSIATINPIQNTESFKKYSYQDSHPKQGNAYYRLKMTDLDGSFEYSKIIIAKLDCSKSSVSVYPNPVNDILNINIANSEDNTTMANLFDINGKLLFSGKMIQGANFIDMTKFSKGVYLLKITGNGQVQNLKIVK